MVQEMRAKVVEAEVQVPLALSEALRGGKLGAIDYYQLQNLIADTRMRQTIAGTPQMPGALEGTEEEKK